MYVYAQHLGHQHKLSGQHSLNTRLPIGPFTIVATLLPMPIIPHLSLIQYASRHRLRRHPRSSKALHAPVQSLIVIASSYYTGLFINFA